MKKFLLCLVCLMALLLTAVACTPGGGDTETDAATEGDTAPVTDPDTAEDTLLETVPETTPETTQEVTTEEPFEPLAFEPSALPSANVAREGYGMASSTKNDGGYSNLYLNDGDLTKGFSTVWGESTDPNAEYYVFIDLASVQTVDAVKLYPLAGDEAGFPVAFEVLVSLDGLEYTTAATVTDTSADAAKDGLEVALGGVQAKFVKLVTEQLNVDAEKGAYLALGEFEVIARIDTAANMVLNRHDIWLYKDPDTTQQLDILYYRNGDAIDASARLRYASMDTAVATVDESGRVTPVGYGETDVYVTDGTNLAVCHVEVKEEVANDFRVTTFYHSTFADPSVLEQALDVLAGGGIEYIEGTRAYDRVGNSISLYMLYLCDERGMAYSPCDEAGGHGFLSMTEEEILAIVQKYENRAGFYGIYLADEPHEEYLQFAEVFHTIQTYNPHLIPHLNLLPPYNFGGIDEYFTEFAAVAGGNGRMHYLTYDHYPFLWNNGFNTQVYSSLNRLRKAGLLYNADTGFYMQSMIITGAYPLLNENALRYNASLGMAYGMKNYKWFVALTPIGAEGSGFETGFVAPDFGPADNYDGLIAANQYIKNMGTVLGNSDAIEVYHTNAEPDNLTLPDDFIFAHVSGGNAIYTLYESLDGSGQQYVVITNKSYLTNVAAVFKIKVQQELGTLTYFDPLTAETTPITVDADGTFTLTLQPGQCGVMILPKGCDAARPEETHENLALNKPVFASSSSATFWEKSNIATYFLTDGDPTNGAWISSSAERAAWLLLDLGEVTSVSEVHVYVNDYVRKSMRCKAFTIYVSEDGVNYTEVYTVTGETYDDVSAPCVCAFDTVNARYIRIVSDTGRPSGFGEIEVYA